MSLEGVSMSNYVIDMPRDLDKEERDNARGMFWENLSATIDNNRGPLILISALVIGIGGGGMCVYRSVAPHMNGADFDTSAALTVLDDLSARVPVGEQMVGLAKKGSEMVKQPGADRGAISMKLQEKLGPIHASLLNVTAGLVPFNKKQGMNEFMQLTGHVDAYLRSLATPEPNEAEMANAEQALEALKVAMVGAVPSP